MISKKEFSSFLGLLLLSSALAAYPKRIHVDDIRETDWRAAKLTHTVDAYQPFIRLHADSALAQQASAQLAFLQAKQEPRVSPSAPKDVYMSVGKIILKERRADGITSSKGPSHSTEQGPSTELMLQTSSGPVDIQDLPGSYLFIHFWASWCVPCRAELPSLISFINSSEFLRLKAGGLGVVFVTIDNFLGEGENYLVQHGLGIPTLYHDSDARVLNVLTGKEQIPVTVILKKDDRTIRDIIPTQNWQSPQSRRRVSLAISRATLHTNGRERR